MIEIVYPTPELIPGYYEALKKVASEKIYLETVEPASLEQVTGYQMSLVDRDGPVYYAVDGSGVVGWCDIFPKDNPRQCHRGSLGMGLLPNYRGQGIGARLLEATLTKAKLSGIEKVELSVYTSNPNAIQLYKKHGFVEEGLIRDYRRIESKVFDALLMAKFL